MNWMLVRAIQHGLVLKPGVEESFKANADTYDRLYDSRVGLASYYRYGPRDIVELSQTEKGKNKLKGNVKIHNTVMQRIEQGTADYAPGLLPNEFDVDIAMNWMLVRAIQHGLVLKPGVEESFKANADTYDRLYDSRVGLASYYRYGPRDIVELSQTEKGKNKLKGNVKIHNTVMQRIEQGTADYAPGLLPNEFDVVETPLKSSITHVQVDKENAIWQDNKNQLLNYINQREWLYRIFAELSLAVVLVSGYMWMNLNVVPQEQSGLNLFERFFGHIADALEYITPAFFENFIHTIIRIHSWIFVALVAAIMAMMRWRKHLKRELIQTSKKLCQMLLNNYQ